MELADSAAVFNFNAASDSISFVLLSRDDIEAIWMSGC
jgi:hypothetical protein